MEGGTWTIVQDGECSVEQTNSDPNVKSLAWVGESDECSLLWQDYVVESSFKWEQRANEQTGALIRMQSTDEYYSIGLLTGAIKFTVQKSGTPIVVTHQPPAGTFGPRFYTFRVEVIGETFNVYVDDVFMVSFKDDTYSQGSVGMITFRTDAIFKSLFISDITIGNDASSARNIFQRKDNETYSDSLYNMDTHSLIIHFSQKTWGNLGAMVIIFLLCNVAICCAYYRQFKQ
eukprot:182314_1